MLTYQPKRCIIKSNLGSQTKNLLKNKNKNMNNLKNKFSTLTLIAFGFVVLATNVAFAADPPALPSPFGSSTTTPELETATSSDVPALEVETTTGGVPSLEVDTTPTPTPSPTPTPTPSPTPTPTPTPAPPSTTSPTPTPKPTPSPTPTPKKIVKTGPELAYLLVPSLALGYMYRRNKK